MRVCSRLWLWTSALALAATLLLASALLALLFVQQREHLWISNANASSTPTTMAMMG
jgi:hypothetical protein